MPPNDTKLTGSAGEHFACSVLAHRDWAASLTRDGLARTDVLAVHTTTRAMIEVQVKTARHSHRLSFPLGRKGVESAIGERESYVLVMLGGSFEERPACWVVPRDHVAAATWISHQNWLTSPDAEPGTRNKPLTGARVAGDVFCRYAERWDLLDDPAAQAPVLLPDHYRELALDGRVGLPPDHPWRSGVPSAWDAGTVRGA